MKTVISHDIYFETKSGEHIRTKISFTNPLDAFQYAQTENQKDTSFGRYFSKATTRVCYESYEEYLASTKQVELQK